MMMEKKGRVYGSTTDVLLTYHPTGLPVSSACYCLIFSHSPGYPRHHRPEEKASLSLPGNIRGDGYLPSASYFSRERKGYLTVTSPSSSVLTTDIIPA